MELRRVGGRHVLLVERFDCEVNGARRRVVSALTVLRLTQLPGGRHATYVALADATRAEFANPDAILRELVARITFNILCGNTDDHGRNHAVFVSDELVLAPAYDICPQARGTGARQAMPFTRGFSGRPARRESQVGFLSMRPTTITRAAATPA